MDHRDIRTDSENDSETDSDADGGGREIVHHIALVEDWDAALADGVYTRSTRGATLADVGFIHCARAEQIVGVLNRYYSDLAEVIVLDLDVDGLDLRDEPVEVAGSIEHYPHLYGPLPLARVTAARKRHKNATAW